MKRGLELSEEKTLITHIDEGFNFLGWNIKKYDGKLLIKPSIKSIERVTRKISQIIKEKKGSVQNRMITLLNPIISGWSNYHQSAVSSKIFNVIDYRIVRMLWEWATKRHPNKGKRWILARYWKRVGNRSRVFKDKTETLALKLMHDKKFVRHYSLKQTMNPYVEREYFQERKFKQGVKKLTGKFKIIWYK